ncbi:hypothetical protein Spock_122 [Bacillus phage Spock]|uniref:Uncharacterized protein n=2 Tax=Bequatrovirus spock TaxID=1918008 RepID=A0A1X9SG32_9CAUD|nr:hypothetical protein Spock_122 [Bacillus phage Spock]AGY48522.1 hypothetical protein Spock_122 [Bacillus phage Spock]ARQ95034.1 hypothetical protein FLAPJACK_123 [Bacillus phage Flapjack]
MRWLEREEPKGLDERVKSRFLLFPKCIDGEYRWLERAYYVQRYWNTYHHCGWENDRWITEEEYLKRRER